jgi:ATP-binding protein involved in chromosome partitioning
MGLFCYVEVMANKVNQHVCQNGLKPIPGIKNIIAIASGKGGVGKSTTAVNLALAIAASGAQVGILDADIYGPSQPLFLDTQAQKPVVRQDREKKRLDPVIQYGLQSMSMGYLADPDAPMVWRGPMVSSALQQLLYETAWHNLDYLIIDLPPGTGDIQLTLAQKIPVAGVVIVTTPQAVALLDAKKALLMFKKLGISILGIVENMGAHICTQCGHADSIFGSEGGQKLALEFKVPLLGQLPLDKQICAEADQGTPTMIADPKGKVAGLYREIAFAVTAQLSLQPRDYHLAVSVIE